MWSRGADCRRCMEERMVALDFGRDEGRNLPDMRGFSMIFVNVQVIGARKRHLLRMRGSTPITSENPISGGNNSSSTKPMKGCFLRSSLAAMGAASFRYAREA